MADARFFNIPFGSSGDRATIPEVVDPGGAVSYAQGFGPDYERDPATDPLAKRVPRDKTNEYLYQITNGLKFLQLYGLPEWFKLDGGGNPVRYPAGAQVRHDAGSGMTAWLSIAASNTAEPGTNPAKWVQASGYAWQHISAAIAAAGLTPNPSSTGQLAAAIAAIAADAVTTLTQTVWNTGTSTDEAVISPAKLAAAIAARVAAGFHDRAYASAETVIANSGQYTFNHGLGARPDVVTLDLVCTAAELGYSIGDVITVSPGSDPQDLVEGLSVLKTATTVTVRVGSNGPSEYVFKNSGAGGILTTANWKLIVRAFRLA